MILLAFSSSAASGRWITGRAVRSSQVRDTNTSSTAAIETVASGEALNNLEWASAIDADGDFSRAQLGRRERDVLHLYASGLPMKDVAVQLGIAPSTVKEYLDRIRGKYVEIGRPAPTKVDLLRRAVEDGILPELNPGSGDDH